MEAKLRQDKHEEGQAPAERCAVAWDSHSLCRTGRTPVGLALSLPTSQSSSHVSCCSIHYTCMHACNPLVEPSPLWPTHTYTPLGAHTVRQAPPALLTLCCQAPAVLPLLPPARHQPPATALLLLLLLLAKGPLPAPATLLLPLLLGQYTCTHAAAAERFPQDPCKIDRHLSSVNAACTRAAAEADKNFCGLTTSLEGFMPDMMAAANGLRVLLNLPLL